MEDVFKMLDEDPPEPLKEEETVDIVRFSPTALGNHAICTFRYYAINILRIREPVKTPLWLGRIWDDTVNVVYEEKKNNETLMPKDVVQDFWTTQFEGRKEEVDDWEDNDPTKLKDTGTKGVELFHKEVFPVVDPESVQEKRVLKFKNSPLTMVGVLDFVEKSGVIGDNKISKSKKKDDFIIQGFQPYVYSLLLDRDQPGKREVRFDVLVMTKKPQRQELKTVVDEEKRIAMLHYISNAMEQINLLNRTKNFMPTGFFSKHQWACKYCSAWELCGKVWKLPLPASNINPVSVTNDQVEKVMSEIQKEDK